MRKVPFINKQFYHVYNRGVDKRDIFEDYYDVLRFFQSIKEFNTINPIGSIYETSFKKDNQLGCPTPKCDKLVNIICYCLNSNHYHLLLEQMVDNGISEFMKRIGGGYTNYFNEKYCRTGSLFGGRFKASHVDSDTYLKHVSVYINLNDKIHIRNTNKDLLRRPTSKLSKSSWGEYVRDEKSKEVDFCKKDMILGKFDYNREKYKKFAKESLEWIIENKEKDKEVNDMLLE